MIRRTLLTVIFFLLLTPAVRFAAAADDPDAPLAETTKEALAEALEASRQTYRKGSLEVLLRDQRDINAFRPKQDEPRMVDMHGRFTYQSDGRRWRGEYHGQTYNSGTGKLSPRSWFAGFDGLTHYTSSATEGFVVGRQQPHENIPIEILFFSSHGEGFAKSLRTQAWEFQEAVTVDGYRCHVLVQETEFRNGKQRYELTISPRQAHLPVRYRVFHDGKLSWSHELNRVQEDPDGYWVPGQVVRTEPFAKRRYDARVRSYQRPKVWEDDAFRVEIPWGTIVRDNREGQVYLKDPWWPEVKTFLRNKYDWPPVDLTPLRDASSLAADEINGKPAPALDVEQWLQGDPQDPRTAKQVTLLHFFTGSSWRPNPDQVAALRELFRVYKPHGLQVVGILSRDLPPEELKPAVAELRIPWPLARDRPSERRGSFGLTFDAYKLRAYLGFVLVDHEGIVHLVERGELARQTKQLLEASGRKDVPDVSLEFVDEPRGMALDLYKQWQTWLPKAEQKATLRGRVTLGGKPQPDVRMTAQLRLQISGSAHSTAATTILPYRKQVFNGSTDEEGHYAISGLWKGTYEVTFVLPEGKRVVEQVSIGESDGTGELNVSLD